MNRADSVAQRRIEAALDDPEQRLVGAGVGSERSFRPAVGAPHRFGDDSPGRARADRLVEGDGDVGPERLLDGDRVLRREAVDRAVEVALEGDPVVVDHAQVAQRDDLEAAESVRIGRSQPMNRCRPPRPSMRSCPGRRYRW